MERPTPGRPAPPAAVPSPGRPGHGNEGTSADTGGVRRCPQPKEGVYGEGCQRLAARAARGPRLDHLRDGPPAHRSRPRPRRPATTRPGRHVPQHLPLGTRRHDLRTVQAPLLPGIRHPARPVRDRPRPETSGRARHTADSDRTRHGGRSWPAGDVRGMAGVRRCPRSSPRRPADASIRRLPWG